MKSSLRYFVASAGMVAWLVVLTAGFACAQNFTGTVAPEPTSSASDGAGAAGEPFADVSLTYSGPVDEFVVEDVDGVPRFIEESSHYTLGKTDVIDITVLRHPEVSGQFLINNEGKIQYEFVGDVKVEGLKKDEVKDILIARLSDYIISPDVTVKISGYNSKIVYVIGEVRRPGKVFMYGDTITVREALVQAGLPLLSAKVTQSRLITPADSGKAERKTVNVHKLLYEGDLRENLVMKPGDTLYIPPTLMAKTLRVLQPVAQPLGVAANTGRRVVAPFP